MLETLKSDELPRSMRAMEQIADHYQIPSINMGLEVAHLEKSGKLLFQGEMPKTEEQKTALGDRIVFSPDSVHPFPQTGHQLYFEAIVRGLERMRKANQPAPHSIPSAFRNDNWEAAVIVPLSRATLSSGWERMETDKDVLAKRFHRQLPEMWKASRPGESIAFRFCGSTAKIYDLLGPDCGQVIVKVDDQEPIVRARFDSFCTYHRLATLNLAEGLSNTVHRVELTIHPGQPDKAKILSQRNEKIDDPKRYDGTAWYAGAILLVGDLVE